MATSGCASGRGVTAAAAVLKPWVAAAAARSPAEQIEAAVVT